MNNIGKDSPKVVEFMTLFARLKNCCNDAPEKLFDFAKRDTSIRDLCAQFYSTAHVFRKNERVFRKNEREEQVLYREPVDPAFVEAWREYEKHYEDVVEDISLFSTFGLFEFPGSYEPEPSRSLKEAWVNADNKADRQARAIGEVIDFAHLSADDEIRWDEDFIQQIIDGIDVWEDLKQNAGFDLRGMFRRRALVPFVLVPKKVAAKHGSAVSSTMLKNLKQAHEAFIYGALALMRSIMEAVLRDHYRAKGDDLSERIKSIRDRLPNNVHFADLHRLRKLANATLHLDTKKDEGMSRMNDEQLEKEIIRLLFVLRALIEGAK